MGIDSDSDRAASLVIGPTSLGMVRIYIESDDIELPMDFDPDEALEIANELRAAAEMAAAGAAKKTKRNRGGAGSRSGTDPKPGGGGRRG